jgi:type IV pilus assembly protein PilW
VDTYDKTLPADWTQVLSIRIAIVARSGQYEKDLVTQSAPLWDLGASSTVTGAISCHNGSQCLPIKVDYLSEGGDANAWQHYRYRIYDATVPLRNIIWNAAS